MVGVRKCVLAVAAFVALLPAASAQEGHRRDGT